MIFGLNAKPLAAGLGLGVAAFLAPPARALTIVSTYDSTIGSMSDAATIEHAFAVATNAFAKRISGPVTVYVDVSWGQLNNGPLPSGALGASSDPLYGSYTFAQVKGLLPGSDVLPANPAS